MGVCSSLNTLSILCFNNAIAQHEQCKTMAVLKKGEFWEARKIRGGF